MAPVIWREGGIITHESGNVDLQSNILFTSTRALAMQRRGTGLMLPAVEAMAIKSLPLQSGHCFTHACVVHHKRGVLLPDVDFLCTQARICSSRKSR